MPRYRRHLSATSEKKKFKRHPCPFVLHFLYVQNNTMLTSDGFLYFLVAANRFLWKRYMEDSCLTEHFRFCYRSQ